MFPVKVLGPLVKPSWRSVHSAIDSLDWDRGQIGIITDLNIIPKIIGLSFRYMKIASFTLRAEFLRAGLF